MSTKPKATVIVPAYNEAEGLSIVLEELRQALPDSVEIIVVDDGSTDGTGLVASHNACRVVSHASNLGKAEAIRTGIASAGGEKIICIDADGSYPAGAIPAMIEALESADTVLASRSTGRTNIPWPNRIGNRLLRSTLYLLYGVRGRDPFTGLYGIRRVHLERMRLGSVGFGIEAEVCLKAASMGLKIIEIPIQYRERIGRPKLRPLRDGYRILRTMFAFAVLYNPVVTFVLPGMILASLGVALMALLYLGPLSLGRITLSTHSLMAAGILTLGGMQAVAFGIAARLYGVAHKFTLPDRLTQQVLRPSVRRTLILLALGLILAGAVLGIDLVAEWTRGGFGYFARMRDAEIVLFTSLFGLHLLFSTGFISILADDVLD
jgi:glycosyltransferase involved in cell wall biosynthesis